MTRRWWGAGAVVVVGVLLTAWAPPAYGWRWPVEAAALRLTVLTEPEILGGPFQVVYPPGHGATAALVLQDLQRDYRVEQPSLGATLSTPLLVVIYPTVQTLNTSAGLPADADNIGLYDAATIRIALPRAWIPYGSWRPTFQAEGPVAHELGHALLDRVGHENYPAWFNEGVAQWEDYRATGYQWLTASNQIGHGGGLYSWRALTENFYALPHQSLAYREGLKLVEYLGSSRCGGPSRFRQFVHALGGVASFAATMQAVYHMRPEALYRAWRRSLPTSGVPDRLTSAHVRGSVTSRR